MDSAIHDARPTVTTSHHPAPERAELRPQGAAALDSRALLQGGKAVAIRHNGELYRLQATRQGKLILTK